MTDLFRTIVPRGVTTCAGMTAHTVILAQARVGFLTGGRKQSFLDLAQAVQMEEAYARATPGRRIACIVSQLICSLIENRWERAHPDLNQGPADLQSAAPTTELCTPAILSGSRFKFSRGRRQARRSFFPLHWQIWGGMI